MPHENTPSLKGLTEPDKSCDKQHPYIIREERKNTAPRLTTTLVKSSRMNFHKVVCILSMMLNYKYLAHAHVH